MRGQVLKGVWVKEHGQVRKVVVWHRRDVWEEMVAMEVKSGPEDRTVMSHGGRSDKVEIEGG